MSCAWRLKWANENVNKGHQQSAETKTVAYMNSDYLHGSIISMKGKAIHQDIILTFTFMTWAVSVLQTVWWIFYQVAKTASIEM